jgi:hypothetical protein
MLSKQEEEQERREVLENDRKVREQHRGSTYHQYGLAQADELSGGRFGALGTPTVTGATPIPRYPAASAAHQIQLPDESPTGYDINEMPPLDSIPEPSLPCAAQDTGGAAAPSVPLDVEHTAPLPSSRGSDDGAA